VDNSRSDAGVDTTLLRMRVCEGGPVGRVGRRARSTTGRAPCRGLRRRLRRLVVV